MNVIAGCLTLDGAAALRKACSQTLKTVELDVGKETSIIQAKENVLKLLPAGKGRILYIISLISKDLVCDELYFGEK